MITRSEGAGGAATTARIEWLLDLPAPWDSPTLENPLGPEGPFRGAGNAPPEPGRVAMRRLRVQRRHRQGGRIKQLLCQSPVANVVPRLLCEMQQILGVRLDLYSLEEPGCRLVWKVTFGYETRSVYCYFILRRLFAGQELDPAGSYYLGPVWEAPDAWLDYTQEELVRLVNQEELRIHSAIGVRTVRVGDASWVVQLQDMLREAYQHPLVCQGA